jgi:hypothetical protein
MGALAQTTDDELVADAHLDAEKKEVEIVICPFGIFSVQHSVVRGKNIPERTYSVNGQPVSRPSKGRSSHCW